MADFHEQLKKIMEEKGITQAELCNRTGIPKSAMSQYISGSFKPKQKRTFLIAKALNVSEAWLIGLENADRERHESYQQNEFHVSEREKQLVIAYRKHPNMQSAVDTLLEIPPIAEEKERRA